MKLNTPFRKTLSLYLALAVIALSFPAQGWAMFVPAGRAESAREADMARIQTILESKAVQQRLVDYGLSADEAAARLNTLSDNEVHRLAADLDSLQAGGELGALIFLLLVAIIVVVVLEATGHRVIIR